MIPIRDTLYSRNLPVVTYFFILINGFIFFLQIGKPPILEEQFIYFYGLVPGKFFVPEISKWFSFPNKIFSFVSYMFLHGGFFHFLGNMWFLYLFGDNVEDFLGPIKFFWFYILCGIFSGLLHFILNPFSNIPTIGASGAVAGVMGAYFILYPKSKILTLIPIIIIPWFVEIPAFIFLGFWFVIQFFNAAGIASSGIAWWAHVGGFLTGLAFIKINQRLPQKHLNQKIKKFIAKKHTPKFQRIVPTSNENSFHLYGDIDITTIEAISGTNKMVIISWGFYNPLYKVKIPAGVKQNNKLRLAGMGKSIPNGLKGDMYLSVNIKNVF